MVAIGDHLISKPGNLAHGIQLHRDSVLVRIIVACPATPAPNAPLSPNARTPTLGGTSQAP